MGMKRRKLKIHLAVRADCVRHNYENRACTVLAVISCHDGTCQLPNSCLAFIRTMNGVNQLLNVLQPLFTSYQLVFKSEALEG